MAKFIKVHIEEESVVKDAYLNTDDIIKVFLNIKHNKTVVNLAHGGGMNGGCSYYTKEPPEEIMRLIRNA